MAGQSNRSSRVVAEVAEYTYQLPDDSGAVDLVDTPAFNAYHPGVEMPTAWKVMNELITYKKPFSHILIFPSISDEPLDDFTERDKRQFLKLCTPNVKFVVVTTRWDEALDFASEDKGAMSTEEEENHLSSSGLVALLKANGIEMSFRRSGNKAQVDGYMTPRELVHDLFGCRTSTSMPTSHASSIVSLNQRKNLLATEVSKARVELNDRLSFELAVESSVRSATLASNEALRDAFQIIKQYSTELREIRGDLKKVENESNELRTRTQQLAEELNGSRMELAGKTKELEIAKDEVEALKRERAEFQTTLRSVKDEMTKHFASGRTERTEASLSAIASSLESLREEQTKASLRIKDQLEDGARKTITEVKDQLKQLATFEETKAEMDDIGDDLTHIKDELASIRDDIQRRDSRPTNSSGVSLLTDSGTSGNSLVDLHVTFDDWTNGRDSEYKAMEAAVFNVKRDGLVWLTTRPVWNRDGEKAGYMRFTAVIKSTNKEVEGLKKEQTQVSTLLNEQLEVTKDGTREIKEGLDRLKHLYVYFKGWTEGLDGEYKAMEDSVFSIRKDGLVWLSTHPVWHKDGKWVGFMRFTALIGT
ncbi:hypothetical protein MD484_g6551, partial [Candolleomyces efflorescens]